jgi:dihydrofolate synthase/folylpolyglutamate synthase
MDYREALDYLLSFADFERSGRFHDRPDVAPMRDLLRRLGDPHNGRLTIHVAGSKGKGSVAAMVESVLRSAGITTGLYTSPHLHSYCERITLNGEPIVEDDFAGLTARLRPVVEAARAELGERRFVTFDLLTALGFLAFQQHGVQAQIVEVGLGGRVDSTNVFRAPDISVITPLSLEHTAVLGDTIERIAREKAAIIRPGSSVVLAPQPHSAAAAIITDAAATAGAPVVRVAERYRWRRLSHDLRGQGFLLSAPGGDLRVRLPLLGEHQMENAATALACVDTLRNEGFAIPDAAAIQGFAEVSWPCRMEVLSERPLVVADGAHNRDSARLFARSLSDYFARTRALLIVGASADKDVSGLAEELAPVADGVIAVPASHPRAMPPERIAAAFANVGVHSDVANSVGEALDGAMAQVQEAGVICLVGSLFVAAEGREHLLGAAVVRH